MKVSRFSDSQIMAILKQAEAGTPAPELCREQGISSATFYKWRTKFGGMDASLLSRQRELEDENRRREMAQEAVRSDQCSIKLACLAFRVSLTCYVRALEQAIEWRGKSQAIRSDNGSEFIRAKLTGRGEKQGIRLDYIQPGRPQQNGWRTLVLRD